MKKNEGRHGIRYALTVLTVSCVMLIIFGAEEFLNSDYGAFGVIAIIIIYLFGRYRWIGFGAAVVWLAITCGGNELWALFDLIPLFFYHGKQGRKMKYFFYAFYPAHLLVLKGIAYLMWA